MFIRRTAKKESKYPYVRVPKPQYFSPQINMRVEMPMASEQYEFIDIWKVGECHGIASNGLNNSL